MSNINIYKRKQSVLTQAELVFFNFLSNNLKNVIILSKVRIADFIQVDKHLCSVDFARQSFYKISNKHIDYLVLDSRTGDIICAVELNDYTHNRPDRVARDEFIGRVLRSCNIPLIWITDTIDNISKETLRPIEREINAYQAPICPYCHLKMEPRENSLDGRRFWGCPNFSKPGSNKCRYTISIDP